MAFDLEHFNNTSAGKADAPKQWTYQSADDLITTIDDSGYFNEVTGALRTGDIIYIIDSSGAASQRTVNSVTGATPVTTIAYAYTGTINTSDIANNAVTAAKLAVSIPRTVTVAMSAAEFLGMYATPKLLVAAGGANTLHIVHDVTYEYNFVTTATAAGGAVAVQYDSTANGAGTLASAATAAATFNGYVADSTVGAAGALASSASTTTVNKGLYLSNLTGAFTTGNPTVNVHVTYSTVTTTV